ncbi:sensor histidine kinase [Pseudoalteromonas xiamenensis]|uniref:histidine kinase n=1 Tax=Pseudoalteromonas xiamenensis TaxID=882626 RepID=A0A975HM41_9GAMM|nr:ATP-binding protein [Pseudoalteromonas xiamenensis]QTH70675.1 DUF4118 domain-containing protein [Pseudoalteromonas xiamenensis]
MFETLLAPRSTKQSYAMSAGIVLIFSVVAISLEALFLPKTGVLLILQMAVIIVSITANRVSAVIASIICALVFNYFATEPLYSLHMADIEDILNTLIFLTIALTTSAFADHYREQSEALKQAEIRSGILLSVSHDLRTPLATIIGSLSTFKEYQNKIDKQQQAELIDDALDESHRLHHYVENLLQATKLSHKAISLTVSPQSVWPILERVAQRLNTPRIALSKLGALKPVEIQDSLLEQAVYNLVDNALKYSPKDSKVTIEAQSTDKSTEINIIDLGAGIAKDKQQKVFELFYTTRSGDSGEGGSGIGLNVAKGIVEAHGGTLQVVESQRGCTMQIVLPTMERNA